MDAVLHLPICVLLSGNMVHSKENSDWSAGAYIYFHAIFMSEKRSKNSRIGCFSGSGNLCQVEKTLSIALNKVGKVRLTLRQVALQGTTPSLCNW